MNKLNKQMCFICASTMLFAASGCHAETNHPNATIRVRVVDDEGQAIGGVRSKIVNIFDMDAPTGLTDENGFYQRHLHKLYLVHGYFTKNWYYKSSGVFWKAPEWGKVPLADTNFTIVLKPIMEPISMKQREVNLTFPRLDEPIGFDLVIGDWVFPDGKGEVADIMLRAEKQVVAEDDFTMKLFVEFSGKHNGIQSFHYPSYQDEPTQLLRSELPPPPIAPDSGYIKTHECVTRRIPNPQRFNVSSTHDKERMWIFRIRTEVDDGDKIVAANYGWFSRDFGIGNIPDGTARTGFVYYYNPDPKSRSLEPEEIADRQGK